MRKWWLCGVLLMAGCATQVMQGYVGRDIRDVMVRYGPPDNAFDMADGRKAYQWRMESSSVTPTYSTTEGRTRERHDGDRYQSTTITTGGDVSTTTCFYTLYATWDEAARGWTVVAYEKPGFECL